jgi:hypothetical protein
MRVRLTPKRVRVVRHSVRGGFRFIVMHYSVGNYIGT